VDGSHNIWNDFGKALVSDTEKGPGALKIHPKFR